MAKGGKYLKQAAPVKKKKKASTVILIVLVVILLLAVIAVAAGIMFYKSKLDKITRPGVEIKNPSQEEIDNIFQYVPDDAVIYDATEATEEPTTETTEPPTEDPTAWEPGKLGKIVNIQLVGQSARADEVGKLSASKILCTIN